MTTAIDDPAARAAANGRRARVLVAGPALVAGAVVGVLGAVVALAVDLGPLVALAILVASVAAGAVRSQRDLGGLQARVLALVPAGRAMRDAADQPRLQNVVEGLCLANGIDAPALRVLDHPSRNAALIGGPEPVILLTTSLLDAVNRIELEGVIAQSLVRIRSGEAMVEAAMVDLAGRSSLAQMAARMLDGFVGGDDEELTSADLIARADIEAAGLTRYPPGLAHALEKVASGATEIDGVPPVASPLWLASPVAPTPADADRDPTHPPLTERLEVLREL